MEVLECEGFVIPFATLGVAPVCQGDWPERGERALLNENVACFRWHVHQVFHYGAPVVIFKLY